MCTNDPRNVIDRPKQFGIDNLKEASIGLHHSHILL